MKRVVFVIALSFLPIFTFAQGLPIKSGTTSDLADVNTKKAVEVIDGLSDRVSYTASMSAQATTAGYALSIESSAGTGFKMFGFCASASPATASAVVSVTVQRRTTASTGGVACTNEFVTVAGTGCAISKLDPADGNYGGIGRNGGTLGTAGAVILQTSHTVSELGAGAADPSLRDPFCIDFGKWGFKPITVLAGVGNGVTIVVSASGAGGLAAGSINAFIVAEN